MATVKNVGLVTKILQNIFCVQQKEETHTGLEHLEGKYVMNIFILGVN